MRRLGPGPGRLVQELSPRAGLAAALLAAALLAAGCVPSRGVADGLRTLAAPRTRVGRHRRRQREPDPRAAHRRRRGGRDLGCATPSVRCAAHWRAWTRRRGRGRGPADAQPPRPRGRVAGRSRTHRSTWGAARAPGCAGRRPTAADPRPRRPAAAPRPPPRAGGRARAAGRHGARVRARHGARLRAAGAHGGERGVAGRRRSCWSATAPRTRRPAGGSARPRRGFSDDAGQAARSLARCATRRWPPTACARSAPRTRAARRPTRRPGRVWRPADPSSTQGLDAPATSVYVRYVSGLRLDTIAPSSNRGEPMRERSAAPSRPEPESLDAHSGPALRTFFRIADVWQLSAGEQMTLLGRAGAVDVLQVARGGGRAAAARRAGAHLVRLRDLQGAPDPLPRPAAGGRVDPPLQRRAAVRRALGARADALGNVGDLYVVRQYLDAQRGGWP
jgi:hypothetical protein